ncbi:MAG: UPF0158 family protein [Methylobacter sp.]
MFIIINKDQIERRWRPHDFPKINLDNIIQALTTRFDMEEGGFFLDTETGDVLLKTEGIDDDDMPEDLEDNPLYLLIDPLDSHESFQIMEDFIDSLDDTKDAVRLREALNRRKPFHQFKDTLYEHTDLSDAWYVFEQKELARLAGEWCEDNRIEAEWV